MTVWNDETQADTARLYAVYKIVSNCYIFSQPDSALYFAELEYRFAEPKGIELEMAYALNLQAIACQFTGNHFKALSLLEKSLEIM